jgi:hypothetical protein
MPALGDVEWSTQIPITAGDRIGEAGAVENCAGDAADHTDYQSIYPNLTTVGQTLSLTQGSPNSRTALWAKLEPDADHDGFGDESQDGCPNNAQLQVACPKPILSAFKLTSLNSFQALITTDFVTTVTGVGTVKLPAAKGKKGKRLTLSSKTIATAPGTQQKLTIKYPSALKHALAELSHKKSLTLNVTITAVGVFENGVKTFKVKLPGKK